MQERIVQRFRNHLHGFSRMSYVHGNPFHELEKRGFAQTDIIDCSLGTNPYGCSPKVLASLQNHDWSDVHRYPDPEYRNFVEALLYFWKPLVSLQRDNILVGAGTSGLLEKILKSIIEPGRSVMGYAPQFTEFVTEVLAQGGRYVSVPLHLSQRHAFDTERFLDAMSSRYSLVYIDNPNNPTGQIIPLESIQKILVRAQDLSLPVLVDEAYGDFISKENSTLRLINEFDNLITVRSFSKGSGLANFRIGYAVMHEQIGSYVRKVDLPFPISSAAAYAAVISLEDEAFIVDCRRKISSSKRKLIDSCPHYYSAVTNDEVPILVLGVEDANIHLGKHLFEHAILTEAGTDFHNLGQQYVRLRIPADIDSLIQRLNSIAFL